MAYIREINCGMKIIHFTGYIKTSSLTFAPCLLEDKKRLS
jgi:hypothetical protein